MWMSRKIFLKKKLSSFALESFFSEKLREFVACNLGVVTVSQEGAVTETCFITGHGLCYHSHMS